MQIVRTILLILALVERKPRTSVGGGQVKVRMRMENCHFPSLLVAFNSKLNRLGNKCYERIEEGQNEDGGGTRPHRAALLVVDNRRWHWLMAIREYCAPTPTDLLFSLLVSWLNTVDDDVLLGKTVILASNLDQW